MKAMTNKEVSEPNKKLFDYLYLEDKPQKADLIIGFGHFDMKIPDRCATLYKKGFAEKIIFTGGIGAGSADLNMPEADAFFEYIKKASTNIPTEDIIIENRSTNTGENLRFTMAILKDKNKEMYEMLTKGKVILVANPFRQRRVFLTAAQILPKATFINCPPKSDYATELALFSAKGENLATQLPGEVHRIMTYPENGWIKKETVPADIVKIAGNKN
jgi:hypothetical protein